MEINDKLCTLHHSCDENPMPESFFRHSHQQYELLYFVRGDAEYNIEGQRMRLRPHDLLVIPPARFHFLHLASGAPYERYCFNFEERILPSGSRERLHSLPTVLNIEDKGHIRACFERLEAYAGRMGAEDMQLMLRTVLREILLNLFYELPAAEQRPVRHNAVLDRVIALIDAHPERDWNGDTLAAELFLSKSYLQNLFARYMEVGLKTYVNTKKVMYAQTLLAGGMKASEACEACGFRDYSTFYRAFRRLTGQTPATSRGDQE